MPKTATAPAPDVLTLREYLRVSHDESGKEKSNKQQHAENSELVDDTPGWVWSGLPAYSDVGSAWGGRANKKERADFDTLIADLINDTFGADALLIWESSRGSRDVGEWAMLLKLCEKKGVRIAVTSHSQLYDPSNHRHWKALMDDALDSEYESRKTSGRVRRDMKASAEAGGIPGGRRAYGYSKDGSEIVAAEAEIIRECVKRVLRGESTRSIAGDLNRRNKKTSAGNDWHPGPLRKMLAGPRIAGLRTHKGEIVAKGVWPAIVDEITHRRLVAILATRQRIGERGTSPWLLTGLLCCEWCGETLSGNTSIDGTRRYVCRKAPGYKGCGRLVIKAEPTETVLGDLAMIHLSDTEARRDADVGTGDDDEQSELDEIAAQRVETLEDMGKGQRGGGLNRADGNAMLAVLDRRRREVETRLAAKARTASMLDLVATESYVGRSWASLEPHEQRIVLDGLINHVTVGPATTRGSKRFEAARVTSGKRIDWKS